MDGRNIYESFTSIPFALAAEDFAEHQKRSFDTHEEALKFLSLYCVLLKETKYTDYNEERYVQNYKKFEDALRKNGSFEIDTKKYSVIEGTCSVE